MNNNDNLLEMVISLLQSQKKEGLNSNTIISLLTLTNLLGIITFLGSQTDSGFKFEDINNFDKPSIPAGIDLEDMGKVLSSFMDGGGGKLNPAMLMSMAKMLSSQLGMPSAAEKDKKTVPKKDQEEHTKDN